MVNLSHVEAACAALGIQVVHIGPQTFTDVREVLNKVKEVLNVELRQLGAGGGHNLVYEIIHSRARQPEILRVWHVPEPDERLALAEVFVQQNLARVMPTTVPRVTRLLMFKFRTAPGDIDAFFTTMERVNECHALTDCEGFLQSGRQSVYVSAEQYIYSMLRAGEELMTMGLHHGDIQPRNLVPSTTGLKLIDFDNNTCLNERTPKMPSITKCHPQDAGHSLSHQFSAPETLLYTNYNANDKIQNWRFSLRLYFVQKMASFWSKDIRQPPFDAMLKSHACGDPHWDIHDAKFLQTINVWDERLKPAELTPFRLVEYPTLVNGNVNAFLQNAEQKLSEAYLMRYARDHKPTVVQREVYTYAASALMNALRSVRATFRSVTDAFELLQKNISPETFFALAVCMHPIPSCRPKTLKCLAELLQRAGSSQALQRWNYRPIQVTSAVVYTQAEERQLAEFRVLTTRHKHETHAVQAVPSTSAAESAPKRPRRRTGTAIPVADPPLVSSSQRRSPLVSSSQRRSPLVSSSQRRSPLVSSSQRRSPLVSSAQRRSPSLRSSTPLRPRSTTPVNPSPPSPRRMSRPSPSPRPPTPVPSQRRSPPARPSPRPSPARQSPRPSPARPRRRFTRTLDQRRFMEAAHIVMSV
jgi:hypothetical protein